MLRRPDSRLASVALLLVAVAGTASAQRVEPVAFVHRDSSAGALAAPLGVQARDSVLRYAQLARVQRRTGMPLLVAGLAGAAAAYVQFSRGGAMGMSGAQAAGFTLGSTVGALGALRWNASRTSVARQRAWEAIAAR